MAATDGGGPWRDESAPGSATECASVGAVEMLATARAEALFASGLSESFWPTREQAADAIGWAVRMYGGVHGCAAELAGAYGDYPDGAVLRMRWARRVVDAVYARAASTGVAHDGLRIARDRRTIVRLRPRQLSMK
jgi:hypothetical protein